MNTIVPGSGGKGGRFITYTTAPYSPAVGGIMLACGCSRPVAFMAYFMLLGFIHDEASRGKHKLNALRDTIDRHCELPGFARALERLGWVTFDEPHGSPMRWNWKLRAGYITKKVAAQLVMDKAKGGAR